jgi:nicotinamide riboside transporter PnuC
MAATNNWTGICIATVVLFLLFIGVLLGSGGKGKGLFAFFVIVLALLAITIATGGLR